MNTKDHGYGDFGNLVNFYAEARIGYPDCVIEWLWMILEKNAFILDVGCGTGISTRQISRTGIQVIGCDKSVEMLTKARAIHDGIKYTVACVENLPFGNEQFSALTAFGAFHWFANLKALSEIKRVLRLKGIFFVVNKNYTENYGREYRDIIKNSVGQKLSLSNVKKTYDPKALLYQAGFKDTEERSFETSEYYTLTQAIQYFQSINLWNLIPPESKLQALKDTEAFCRTRLINGKMERRLHVVAIKGVK